MYLIKERDFRQNIKRLYLDFNAAPSGVPGALVIYQDLYAVFETVAINPKKNLFFDTELWRKYSNRLFNSNRAYQHKSSGKFESEQHKNEIIALYSGLQYVIDDLTEYPHFKENRCWWCGKPLEGRLDKFYCSKACGNAFRAFAQSDEYFYLMEKEREGSISSEELLDCMNILKDRINKNYVFGKCLFCGEHVKRSNAKFCSEKCRYGYHNKMKKLRD